MRVLAILYKGFRDFIAGVFGGGFRFARKWPERCNIAFSAPLRHGSARFWRLKVHADTRLSRRPAGRREETTVYRDRNLGIEGSKPRYRRIETSVYKDRNLGMEAAKPRYGRTKKRLSGSSPTGISRPAGRRVSASQGLDRPPRWRAMQENNSNSRKGLKNEMQNRDSHAQ